MYIQYLQYDRLTRPHLPPEYADRKVIGAVAGIIIDEGADKFAYKIGLFVIVQSGETVKITNDDEFSPMECSMPYGLKQH